MNDDDKQRRENLSIQTLQRCVRCTSPLLILRRSFDRRSRRLQHVSSLNYYLDSVEYMSQVDDIQVQIDEKKTRARERHTEKGNAVR
jgi:hypothetical protein